mgnify:FL=1
MGNVFVLNRRRVFTLGEATELLPVIRRITDDYNSRVQALINLLESVRDRDQARARDIEAKINFIVEEWQTKIEKLGAEGKGLWLVDFDSGTGYYCWKYPEERLEHFHSYTEGFQARVKISKEMARQVALSPLTH